jgi:hypothetical protein
VARLLVLDTNATQDADGNPILDYNGNPVTGGIVPALPLLVSQPVRLYGCVDGGIEEIAYEILFDGLPAVDAEAEEYIDLLFWQEFYSDEPSRGLPRDRTYPDIPPNTKWPRETVTFADGCSPGDAQQTIVRSYIQVRKIRIGDGVNTITGLANDEFSALIACKVNGLFARLAVNLDVGEKDIDGNDYRLRIWAIVGGQDNETAQDNNILPYTP